MEAGNNGRNCVSGRCDASGSYTLNAQKVYTNGHTLQVGAQFRDGFDGQIYTVKQELTHGPVHSMKRYMVEKKGESNPK